MNPKTVLENRFANRAQENRFYDPNTVLDRDEGGAEEQLAFDADDAKQAWESDKNMVHARRRDQLNNTFSAWNDNISSHKYDYPECERSDEGLKLDSDRFEDRFANAPERPEVTNPDTFTDEENAWNESGYESADMFGEAIDKLAKVTGQFALCEAVKKIYKICAEAK